jgi:hypothetical protein
MLLLGVCCISAVAGVPLVSDVSLLLGSLLLLESLVLLAFLLLLSSLLLLGFLRVLAFLLLLSSLVLLTFLLILASLCYCSWYLYILYCTMRHIRPSDYRTTAIEQSDSCYQTIFLPSDYRNIEYRAGELEKLSDYRTSVEGPSTGLSDIGLTKIYRLPSSAKFFLQMEKYRKLQKIIF